MQLKTLVVGALAAVGVSAHPGHDLSAELAEREAALSQFAYRDLSHCADKIRERGLEARSVARRNALVEQLQKKAKLKGGLPSSPSETPLLLKEADKSLV